MTEASIDAPRLVNLSEIGGQWQWLKAPFAQQLPDWHHVTSETLSRPMSFLRARQARWRAAREAARLVAEARGRAILVSHGPRPAAYWSHFAPRTPLLAHDVVSFNFTDMPRGLGRRFFASGFGDVSRFIVSSRWEREYYADFFGIPIDRIEFRYWGVQPPDDGGGPPLIPGRYVCAIGSQARDYRTLVDAIRRLPDVRCVIVGGADSLAGVDLPANVEFRSGIPLNDAMNILRHSALMALPMNSDMARCGHVTVVSALHLGVPVIATRCRGLTDYLQEGDTALCVAAGDGRAMAEAIEALWSDESSLRRMGEAGRAFARQCCTEEAVVDAFRQSLVERGLLNHMRTAPQERSSP